MKHGEGLFTDKYGKKFRSNWEKDEIVGERIEI